MSDAFKVGEIAELCNFSEPGLACLNGEEVTIIGARVLRPCLSLDTGAIRMKVAFAVDLRGVNFAVDPENLRKKRDKQDDQIPRKVELGSWDTSPWRPAQEVA